MTWRISVNGWLFTLGVIAIFVGLAIPIPVIDLNNVTQLDLSSLPFWIGWVLLALSYVFGRSPAASTPTHRSAGS